MKKAMKIMAMVLFVVGMTALTSCTKDNSDLIIGKWKFDKASVSFGGESMEMTAADILAMMNYNGVSEDDFIIEFKSDGKVYASDEPEPANYTVDGDKLKIIAPDTTFEMLITKLTNTTLIVEPQFDDQMPDGAKAEIRFKRL